MKKYICFLTALLAVGTSGVRAQNNYDGKIKVVTREAVHRGDSVYLSIDLSLQGVSVASDRSLTLTPMLMAGDRNCELPSILINGATRQRLYNREHALNRRLPKPYLVLTSKRSRDDRAFGNYDRTLSYKAAVAYADWMQHARVVMLEDLCGCAGHAQQVSIEPLVNRLSHETVVRDTVMPKNDYAMHLTAAFVRPQVEARKERGESHEINLHFPVGKTTLLPDFSNNGEELARIETQVRNIQHASGIQLTNMSVRGTASIEGSEASNARLSAGRAQALLGYLSARTRLPYGICRVLPGGEDWEMMRKEVAENPLFAVRRYELEQIIDQPGTADRKEQLIRQLDNGTVYRMLNDYLFPRMRRVICRLDYVVKPYTVDEARQVYVTQPQHLSLDELYQLANSYEITDPHFGEVFETAARLFPDSRIANLNAAASYLQQGNTERAKQYLDKLTDTDLPEYANNMGVYYLLKGDYTQAAQWLDRAAARGCAQAAQNKQELLHKQQSLKQ
ncbi:MAG: DUF3868 domain-containing protein [Prevotellaceae bacterium]|jgi:tetratricopeptide (TPR) repeat protein|nr:DUF3868 domain-containing protein [Prevotellaceae bacterium]